MSKAQTITPAPATARRSPIDVALDYPWRSFTGIAGAAGVAAGWWWVSALPYLLGVAFLAGLAVAVWRSRPVVAVLTAVTIVVTGFTAPWLAVRLAYRHEGSRLSSDIPPYIPPFPHFALPSSDGGLRILGGGDITALGPDGKTRWRWGSGFHHFEVAHALPGDSLVVAGERESDRLPVVALGPDGKPRWSITAEDYAKIIAISDRTLVTRMCSPSGCRHVGHDVTDGSITWTLTAHVGRVESALDLSRPPISDPDLGLSFGTDWFASADTSGAGQLRSADTGEVVRSYPEGHRVWEAGDVALIIGPGPSGCVLEIARTGRASPPSVPVDCSLMESFGKTRLDNRAGMRTGDALWSETTKDGSAYAVDLNTGTTRKVPPYWSRVASPANTKGDVSVLGAGVQVESTRDAVVTRDAVTGKTLWRLDLPAAEVPTIVADGRLVVVTHRPRRLLLDGLFAPEEEKRWALRAFDARSGELRYQARTGQEPVIMGDRMLAYLPDRDGRSKAWLFAPSG
ncbi:PQQ-binding-like beta-propeller repeat protein [Micromonospora sp. DT31]|uniref:outer membrane protein assembly factor BamB family protein n=1 Tax=Micromonospora sp. DT31 TaxID=3393434 RepID=UPI003CF52A2C